MSGGVSRSLAHLSGHVLALVADALALVGLRRALLADVGGDLADELLVDPLDDDARRLRDLELDPLRRLDRHGVRVAERELEVAAAGLGPVADALDLQRLGVALGDAVDHVEDERARQTVQRAVVRAVGRALDEDRGVLLLDGDVARDRLRELAAGAVHAHDAGVDADRDAVGHGDGLLADAGHGCGYQTSATTSPPTRALRASWPVMTPLDVLMIVVPMPPCTLGMCVESTYVRRPGRETRRRPEMTGWRRSV